MTFFLLGIKPMLVDSHGSLLEVNFVFRKICLILFFLSSPFDRVELRFMLVSVTSCRLIRYAFEGCSLSISLSRFLLTYVNSPTNMQIKENLCGWLLESSLFILPAVLFRFR